MLTNEVLGSVYGALKAAVLDAYEAGEGAIAAKNALEATRLAMLMTGEIDGKNEAQREAKARELLAAEYDGLESAEAQARRARVGLDLAKLDVELVRAQLRLAELAEVQVA